MITTKDGNKHTGTILQQLERGYLFKLNDGSTIVIDYAQVDDVRASTRPAAPALGDEPVPAPVAAPAPVAPPEAAASQEDARQPLAVDQKPPVPFAPVPSIPAELKAVTKSAQKSEPRRRAGISITAGGLVGELAGGAIALPIRVGLLTVDRELLRGTVALLVTPWLLAGIQQSLYGAYIAGGGGLALGVGWHQRLGPFEVFPHVGANTAVVYRSFNAAWGVSVVFKGLVGLAVALPAGESKKFIIGGQALLGGSPLGHLYLGMEF